MGLIFVIGLLVGLVLGSITEISIIPLTVVVLIAIMIYDIYDNIKARKERS